MDIIIFTSILINTSEISICTSNWRICIRAVTSINFPFFFISIFTFIFYFVFLDIEYVFRHSSRVYRATCRSILLIDDIFIFIDSTIIFILINDTSFCTYVSVSQTVFVAQFWTLYLYIHLHYLPI